MRIVHSIYREDNLSSRIDLDSTTEREIKKLIQATKEGPDKQVKNFQRKYLLITLPFFHLLMSTDIFFSHHYGR